MPEPAVCSTAAACQQGKESLTHQKYASTLQEREVRQHNARMKITPDTAEMRCMPAHCRNEKYASTALKQLLGDSIHGFEVVSLLSLCPQVDLIYFAFSYNLPFSAYGRDKIYKWHTAALSLA